MTIVRVIASFLELSSLLIIWSKFEKNSKILLNLIIAMFLVLIGFMIEGINPIFDFIISYSLIVVSLSVIYKVGIIDTLLKIIVSFAIIVFVELIILIIIAFIYGNSFQTNNYIILVIANTMNVIISYVLYKNTKANNIFAKINNYITDINFKFRNIWIANTLFYCMCIKIVWDYSPAVIIKYKFFIFLIFLLIYVVNIFIFKNDVLMYEKNKMQEYYDKYSPVMASIVEDIRGKQHEYKNHINAIYGIIQVADEDTIKQELESYIISINENLDQINIVKSDNSIINAIIYSKVCDANNFNIKFDYSISKLSKLPIQGFEMSEILSNLLNNAFEAVMADENNKKIVMLIIQEDNDILTVEVRNSGHTLKAQNIDKIFRKGFSTKNRGSGYGLHNVKQIVDDNKGKVMISIDSGFTVFKVSIPKN
ncbi:GHKL domain-containing protein [Clostridiaceae bacterium M8S5]|nr:GHKL domain-containing protein [Clostridiaceae bacterium M8S5]